MIRKIEVLAVFAILVTATASTANAQDFNVRFGLEQGFQTVQMQSGAEAFEEPHAIISTVTFDARIGRVGINGGKDIYSAFGMPTTISKGQSLQTVDAFQSTSLELTVRGSIQLVPGISLEGGISRFGQDMASSTKGITATRQVEYRSLTTGIAGGVANQSLFVKARFNYLPRVDRYDTPLGRETYSGSGNGMVFEIHGGSNVFGPLGLAGFYKYRSTNAIDGFRTSISGGKVIEERATWASFGFMATARFAGKF